MSSGRSTENHDLPSSPHERHTGSVISSGGSRSINPCSDPARLEEGCQIGLVQRAGDLAGLGLYRHGRLRNCRQLRQRVRPDPGLVNRHQKNRLTQPQAGGQPGQWTRQPGGIGETLVNSPSRRRVRPRTHDRPPMQGLDDPRDHRAAGHRSPLPCPAPSACWRLQPVPLRSRVRGYGPESMPASALIAVLAAALLHASWNLVLKSSSETTGGGVGPGGPGRPGLPPDPRLAGLSYRSVPYPGWRRPSSRSDTSSLSPPPTTERTSHSFIRSPGAAPRS